ncbi:hypothetical protein EZV62_021827 [Acer yangbiense]|uniref:PGG domain-containing protein n=1 Tax=Acer yangbiense TaxID=1000413 RepID=A0A5C7H6I7_9ROSI|nr:hypothetical protein EZV62_021827 [Acer yangbiense]
MDRRLYVAAFNGDVQALIELVREDPLILFTATVATTSDNPLHIAALLGHNEFAKLAMAYNPKLSTEFNRYGYSPIHLASLKGQLQIVKDLVDMEKGLCVLKDCSEGKTALHCAAIKGRIDVIGHLLSCCPESAKELTFKSETMLHLVVKNSQGQIMTPLISILRELNLVEDLINCVDDDGNTVLHLATSRKQYQIIKVLLRDTNVNSNAVNAAGYNASAILEMNIIKAYSSISSELDNTNNIGSVDDDKKQYSSVDSIKNGIIVVCSLFATFCLEAILNLPGGIDREKLQSKPMNITVDQLQKFDSFLMSGVACFVLSVTTIFLVTISSYFHSKYSLHLNAFMVGALMVSAASLFKNVLVLATTDHLAHVAIQQGVVSFVKIMGLLILFHLLITKKFRSFIGKECSKIRDSMFR